MDVPGDVHASFRANKIMPTRRLFHVTYHIKKPLFAAKVQCSDMT